jgi:hypothetical protein
MKRTSAFSLALLVVVICGVLNHSNAQAQQQPGQQTTVRLHKISSHNGATIQVPGRIVGFSCAPDPTTNSVCFVATAD